jgi:hypothetical protein
MNAALGAVIGSFAPVLARPGPASAVLPPVAVLGLLTTAALGAVHGSGPVRCAAAVSVLCLALCALAPRAAGFLTARSARGAGLAEADTEAVESLVLQTRGLLVTWNAVLCCVLAAASVLLALSGNVYALGLCACAALALLARSAGALLLVEAVPQLIAASVGLVCLAFGAHTGWHAAWWVGPSAATALGALVLAYAAAMLPRGDGPVRRSAASSYLAVVCAVATVPLAAGVFGAYPHLAAMGHSL